MELPLRLVRALNTLFRSPHKLLSRLGASNQSGRGLWYVTPPHLTSLRTLLSRIMLIIAATGPQADPLVGTRIVACAIPRSTPTRNDNPGTPLTTRRPETPPSTEARPGPRQA